MHIYEKCPIMLIYCRICDIMGTILLLDWGLYLMLETAKIKTIKKNVNFEYFTVSIFDECLKNLMTKFETEYKSKKTREKYKKMREQLENLALIGNFIDFSDVFKYMNDKTLTSRFILKSKNIDVDSSTFFEDDDYVFFQVCNNRDINLPSKREIGGTREMIQLKDNEYIGEFTSILYHKETKVFMIQKNRYSVTVTQFTKILSDMFNEYLRKVRNLTIAYIMLELRPVVDYGRLGKINNKNVIDTVKLSGTSSALIAMLGNKEKALHFFGKFLNSFQVDHFELKVTAKKDGIINRSVNVEEIEELIKQINISQKNNQNIDDLHLECGVLDEKLQKREMINYFLPTINETIEFEMKLRTNLSFEIVRDKMIGAMRFKLTKLREIIGHIE